MDVKRDNTGTKINRRQGKFHDTKRYSQRQDFLYRTYNYRNNRDVQDNTNQRRDFNIYNRYHDNRNNDRQHYNTDRYDNRNNDRQHYNTNIYYEEGFDNSVNSHQYEQSPDNTNFFFFGSSWVTENHQRTDVYFPAHVIYIYIYMRDCKERLQNKSQQNKNQRN